MVFVLLLVLNSCQKSKVLKNKVLDLPSSVLDYTTGFENNKEVLISEKIKDKSIDNFNNHTATLGRVLFYDNALSINNSVSCASCHEQSKAFTDGKASSIGFSNGKTPRNAMSVVNVVENNNMFWDSRSKNPLDLSLKPVFNHIEMGILNDDMLVKQVQNMPYYSGLFLNAFNSSEITKDKISIALTVFMNAIFSKNSKFDKESKENFSGFSPLEKIGFELFNSNRMKCNQCHSTSNFSAPDFPGGPYGSGFGGLNNGKDILQDGNNNSGPKGTANIGLDLVYKDNGLFEGQFKIPTLRNIALTSPYMHDGRFKTLEEVLNHYSHGIKMHPNLDPKFIDNNQAIKLQMTNFEKEAIIAFLNTLTDYSLINNIKFSDPFKIEN